MVLQMLKNMMDDLVDALRKHKVDAIFVDNALANFTQVLTNDLSQISGAAFIIVFELNVFLLVKQCFIKHIKFLPFSILNLSSL